MIETPRIMSPFIYFQERYREHPWRLLCCTIMLNLTTGVALESVHEDFFRYFPAPESAVSGDTELMTLILQPLGMQNIRVKRIKGMSRDYLEWDGKDPADLYGIGKYGSDSYRIFVFGELLDDVNDKELKKYVEWAKDIISSKECSCSNI